MSDKNLKGVPIFSDEDAKEIVSDMGFKTYDPEHKWYVRIKCRLFGPHDWISIMGYDVMTKKMTEEGAICERCHKEAQWTSI